MIMIAGMGGWDPPPWDQRLCTYINAAEEPSEARTAVRVCIYTNYMRSHFGPSEEFLQPALPHFVPFIGFWFSF